MPSLYVTPDAAGDYVDSTGKRLRFSDLDNLRLVADEQLRTLRKIDVPLSPIPGFQVYKPDSLGNAAEAAGLTPFSRVIRAADYLPPGTLPDGTRSSVSAIAKALALCKRYGFGLDLRGGTWLVDQLDILKLHTDLVMYMEGAKILGPLTMPNAAGIMFQGSTVDNVQLIGGFAQGYRDVWDAPVPGQNANLGPINALGRSVRSFVFDTGSSRIAATGLRGKDFNAPVFSADASTDVTLNRCRFTRSGL
jgi:hypothetical protein